MSERKPACRIACALCVGDAREPYLAATLASIEGAVDALVVNDNSGRERSENVATLQASAFARDNRLIVAAHSFVDFATMRNDAHAMLRALDQAPDWVLFIDADEVHGDQVRYLAREVLPNLPEDVVELDAYTFHFWGTFGWITDIARRMAFYRFSPGLRWENAVHEKLRGNEGRTVVVPYIYHHYGNVLPPRMLADKHARYYALGNPVPRPPDPDDASLAMFAARAGAVRPFHGSHPSAARDTIEGLTRAFAQEFALLDAEFEARRGARLRLQSALRAANEALRVRLRAVEHPGLFRAPLVAT